MEKLNYFTDEFNEFKLYHYFDSLNEEKLKYELENFINQYLKLSEEEQPKYVEPVLNVCRSFAEEIEKSTQRKILETLNKLLSKKLQLYSWFEIFSYLHILYYYLLRTEEYEEYSILFEKESYFFNILNLVLENNLEERENIYLKLLSVFDSLFRQNSLPEKK